MSYDLLQRALQDHPDVEVREWLRAAVRRWQEGQRLEQAMGLSGTRAMIVRDAALRAAADAMDPRAQLSHWARAGRLADRIVRFEHSIWPSHKNQPEAQRLGVNGHLLRAFRTGTYIPKSQRALWSVLKNESEDFKNAG